MYVCVFSASEARARQSTTTVTPPLARGRLCSPGADTAVARPSEQTRGVENTHRHTLVAPRCMKTHTDQQMHTNFSVGQVLAKFKVQSVSEESAYNGAAIAVINNHVSDGRDPKCGLGQQIRADTVGWIHTNELNGLYGLFPHVLALHR